METSAADLFKKAISGNHTLIIAIAIIIFFTIANVLLDKKRKTKFLKNITESYMPKPLLSINEFTAYKKLKEICDPLSLEVLTKVRFADIIEPKSVDRNYTSLLNRIIAKHVDFIICKADMTILTIVEIDDKSHNNRKEIDEFKNKVLLSCGYKIIRTYYITENTKNEIEKYLVTEKPCQ